MEEIRQKCGLQLQNEDIYMATKFEDFIQRVVRKLRGEDREAELMVDYVSFSLMLNFKLFRPAAAEDMHVCHAFVVFKMSFTEIQLRCRKIYPS